MTAPTQNNSLVSVGTPGSLFMPSTVTQMNATPLASIIVVNIANSNIMNLLGKPSLPASAEYRKVFVHRIPPGLSDHFIVKLLETCGPIGNWKRGTDHNGKARGFGYCEYQSVEGMLKALRLLNHLKLEEGYELAIKVDQKTEDFLRQWREQKKQDWIDQLRLQGISVNVDEIRKKELAGTPLEWELNLIAKDAETRRGIFDILTQRDEIENFAKSNEKAEEFLKDFKDFSGSFFTLYQYRETEREKERAKRKLLHAKKLEKMFKDEERKWEEYEEHRDREKDKQRIQEETRAKKIKRLIEADLNHDSSEEKAKIKKNPKKYEEYQLLRMKERESDEQIRKKENPTIEYNTTVQVLVPMESNENNQIMLHEAYEPEAKTQVIVREYNDDDETGDPTQISIRNLNVNLNLEERKPKNFVNVKFNIDEEENPNDPYSKKKRHGEIKIDEETEKVIKEINNEVEFERKEEEKRKIQKEQLGTISNKDDDVKRMLEIQKQISEMVPKIKEELFKFPINWSIVIKNELLDSKLKPWLSKKTKEYLSEEEPSLIQMILKKLHNKASPYEIISKIKVVFEDDTEEFVFKMWRILVYEVLKAEKLGSL